MRRKTGDADYRRGKRAIHTHVASSPTRWFRDIAIYMMKTGPVSTPSALGHSLQCLVVGPATGRSCPYPLNPLGSTVISPRPTVLCITDVHRRTRASLQTPLGSNDCSARVHGQRGFCMRHCTSRACEQLAKNCCRWIRPGNCIDTLPSVSLWRRIMRHR